MFRCAFNLNSRVTIASEKLDQRLTAADRRVSLRRATPEQTADEREVTSSIDRSSMTLDIFLPEYVDEQRAKKVLE